VRHKLQVLALAILAGVIFGLIQLVAIPSISAAPIQAESIQAVPSNQVILTDTQGKYPLGLHLDILEDKQKQWTIQDVATAPLSQQFFRSQSKRPSFGFTTSAYWVCLQLNNQARTNTDRRLEIEYPLLDQIDLFLPQDIDTPSPNIEKQFTVKHAGDSYPFSAREVDDRNFIFKLPLTNQTESTIYLRFQTTSTLTLRLTLWTLEAFSQSRAREQLSYGCFYGIIFVMSGYNFLLYLTLRDRSYLYYVAFVIGAGLYFFANDGLAVQYLWPDLMWWNNISIVVLAAIAASTALGFMNQFLQTQIYAPRFRKPILVLNIAWFIVIVAAFVGSYQPVAKLAVVLMAISCVVGVAVGLRAWQKGYRPARYYVLAWTGVLIGAFIYSLVLLAILPSNTFTQESIRFGMIAMIFLLSLALADRINILKQERVEAQAEVMREQQEALKLKDEITITLQKSKDELEQRVEERTSDLTKAKEVADAANKAKSEFLANMSHELRTPLNAILGFTQIMQHDALLNAEQQENLDIISHSGDHLLALIDDVLEMSRIEAGRLILNNNNFDLLSLLENVEKMFSLRAKSQGLDLRFEISQDLPRYTNTDEGKLRQILINILGNAIKFTQKGRVTVRAKLAQGEEHNSPRPSGLGDRALAYTLIFEVEDTGIGIAAKEIDGLFDAFVQTASGRISLGGTGLGLAISRKFVQMMGGDIHVMSVVGQGTLFKFDVQASTATESDSQSQVLNRRVVGLAPDQPQHRILIVDDKYENRQLLAKLLAPVGFEVKEAEHGQAALAIWESWAPHLIWMDMRMPIMDGYEAARQIKAQPRGQSTIIIALTASAFEEERAVVLATGCNDFVHKPFHESVIFEKMAQYLGVRYVYTPSKYLADHLTEPATTIDPLNVESLTVMPNQWRSDLYHASAKLNAKLILQLIAQIPQEHSLLARAIEEKVKSFDFEQLMNLAQLSITI
jgi:signal transduction histidine kinase/DNA-binding response OmpR family regulator